MQTTVGSGYVTHFFKKNCSPQEDVGKLVRTALAWTQYQSSLSYGILQHPWTPISYVKGHYYKRLMAYLGDINGSINHSPSYVQPKLCSNNQAIMEITLESDAFTKTQLRLINWIKMYLGFTYISEMCYPNGRCLYTSILSRIRDEGQ